VYQKLFFFQNYFFWKFLVQLLFEDEVTYF